MHIESINKFIYLNNPESQIFEKNIIVYMLGLIYLYHFLVVFCDWYQHCNMVRKVVSYYYFLSKNVYCLFDVNLNVYKNSTT